MDQLTKREMDVLKLFAYSTKGIASILGITQATVKNHRWSIIEKLGADYIPRPKKQCDNLQARAVLLALKKGIIKLNDFNIGE